MVIYNNSVFFLLEGFLFVMGGTDEHKTVLDSGEKYDPDSNTWSPIPPMLQVNLPITVTRWFFLFHVPLWRQKKIQVISSSLRYIHYESKIKICHILLPWVLTVDQHYCCLTFSCLYLNSHLFFFMTL